MNFAPQNWALCNGATLAISGNTALYALVGTTFGGNGQTTFELPDLRGRTPVHVGGGVALGQAAGEEMHTLAPTELPMHSHMVAVAPSGAGGGTNAPDGHWLGDAPGSLYALSPNTTLKEQAVGSAGSTQPHENRQPSLALNFCIATMGIFPSRH